MLSHNMTPIFYSKCKQKANFMTF